MHSIGFPFLYERNTPRLLENTPAFRLETSPPIAHWVFSDRGPRGSLGIFGSASPEPERGHAQMTPDELRDTTTCRGEQGNEEYAILKKQVGLVIPHHPRSGFFVHTFRLADGFAMSSS